jgi:hypothetical protein
VSIPFYKLTSLNIRENLWQHGLSGFFREKKIAEKTLTSFLPKESCFKLNNLEGENGLTCSQEVNIKGQM